MKRSMGILLPGLDWLTTGEAIALNDVVRLSAANTCLKAGDGETGYGVALIAAAPAARVLVRKNGRATVIANGVVAVGDRVVAAGVVGPPDTRGRVISLNNLPTLASHPQADVAGALADHAVHNHDLDLTAIIPDGAATRVQAAPALGYPGGGITVPGGPGGVLDNAAAQAHGAGAAAVAHAAGALTGQVLGKALTAAGGAGVSLTVMLEG